MLIQDGKIARIDRRIEGAGGTTHDLSGLVVCPGFIDIHVHLREPGQEWKETIRSGAEAAARHHYGTSALMLNREQSARLAACLPDPRRRAPEAMDRYSEVVQQRMQMMGW